MTYGVVRDAARTVRAGRATGHRLPGPPPPSPTGAGGPGLAGAEAPHEGGERGPSALLPEGKARGWRVDKPTCGEEGGEGEAGGLEG